LRGAGAAVRRPDDFVLDSRGRQELERLRVLAGGDQHLCAARAQARVQRAEEGHVRRVRHVDPDAHGATLARRGLLHAACGMQAELPAACSQ
jgi:hypothetical protein